MNISDKELNNFYNQRLKRILAEHSQKIINDKDFGIKSKQEHIKIMEKIMNIVNEKDKSIER